MQAEELIERLGAALGLEDLALNQDRVARLIVGETLVVDLEPDEESGQLHLHAGLGVPPATAAGLRELLAANLFGIATGGATLGLDDEEDEIALTRSFQLESVQIDQLVQALNLFVQAAELWTSRLAGVASDGEDVSPPAAPGTGVGPSLRV